MWVKSRRAFEWWQAISVGLLVLALLWVFLFLGSVPRWAAQQRWVWWAEWGSGGVEMTWLGVAIWLVPPALLVVLAYLLYPAMDPDRKRP